MSYKFDFDFLADRWPDFVAGAWLTRRVPDRWFFRLVQGTLFVVSCKLVLDGLRG